jgi:hypothetical protein
VDGLQVLINALVVGAVGTILAAMTHGLRREIGQLRAELKGDISALRTEQQGANGELRSEIGALRTELKAEIVELRIEMREVRSDLTRVALAVGAEHRAGNQ